MVNASSFGQSDSDVGDNTDADNGNDLDLSIMMVLGSDSVGAPVFCYTVSPLLPVLKNQKREKFGDTGAKSNQSWIIIVVAPV